MPSTTWALAVASSSSSTLYAGTTYGLYKSTDGAATWNATSLTDSTGQDDIASVVVDPTNASTVYVGLGGTAGGVRKSTDGGATWNPAGSLPAGYTYIAMDPVGPQTLYAAIGSSGLYKTTDGGATWTQLPFPSQSGYVEGIKVDPQLHTRLWASADGGVYVSLDSELRGRERMSRTCPCSWSRTQAAPPM